LIDSGELTTLGTAVTVSGGVFSIDVSLSQGVNKVVAKQTDVAGNVSDSSTALTVTVDTTPPPPVLTSVVYDNTANQFTITGSGLNDGTLDFTKMTYQFDGQASGVTMTFTGATEVSRSATQVVVALTGGDASSLETNNKFGGKSATTDDSFRLDSGFQTDAAGNTSPAVTPATANFAWAGISSGPNVFTGSTGNDTITGGAADDKLSGGNGNDLIRGGEGGDSLLGGAGADTFVFEGSADSFAAVDTISDFISLSDKLDFSAFSSSAAVDVTGSLTTTAHTVYVLSGQSAGSADSASAVAAALSGAAIWTGADAVAWVLVSDDNSASVWEWTDTATLANEVGAAELVQMATIKGTVVKNDLAFIA